MLTLPSLLSAGLWILGLAGVLATVSYADWRRSLHPGRWGGLVTRPRLLSPFFLSFTLVCSGMALAAITYPSPSWWQFGAWSVLALIFACLAVVITLAGVRNGWDAPFEGMRQP